MSDTTEIKDGSSSGLPTPTDPTIVVSEGYNSSHLIVEQFENDPSWKVAHYCEVASATEVNVVYKGYFTDDAVFDESAPNGVTFNLSQVIPGWTEGLQYFKEGGKGKLFIPSSLAYGRYGNQSIPGGAVLIFDIDLITVN